MSFLHRTNTGRVVYQRARNFFSYQAVARILRSMIADTTQSHPEDALPVLVYAMENLRARWQDVGFGFLKDLARSADATGGTLVVLRVVELWIEFSRRQREMTGGTSFFPRKTKGLFGLPFNPFAPPPAVEPVEFSPGDWFSPLVQARDEIDAFLKEVGDG